MKGIKKLFSVVALVMVMAMMAACVGSSDYEKIDKYVESNSSEAATQVVKSSGMFDDYKVERDGYDIVLTFTFIEDVDLSEMDDSILEGETETFIAPIRKEYKTVDFVKECVDVMKAHGGRFIYNYYDHAGNRIGASVAASEI